MTRAELHTFIAGHRYAVLGTVSSGGTPQGAVVGIAVTSDLEIVFDTVKTSRKYGNLLARPECSVTLWTSETTVQYEGRATELTGSELEGYREAYFAAFPDGRDRLSWPGITHFVIRPKWIRYSDFDKNPQQIEEFRF